MVTLLTGGWGQAPWGQHQAGSAASDFEPRFCRTSRPKDGQLNVILNQWITFEVYYHSSYPVDNGVLVQPSIRISEDGGDTFVDAGAAPFTLTVREKDGHTLWVKIVKAGNWPEHEEVIIEMTRPDTFGQTITKDAPAVW